MRRNLLHEPEAYPPFDGWYYPSLSDLTRLHYLMNREEQQNWFSRHSHWWVQIGDELYLPLHNQQEGPVPQLSSSSLPSHDVIMQALTVRATPKPASSMAHSTVTRALALWAHT